ncbi:S8 family serine peptidase [Flavobacterium ardleyense]|uniref:S8 family serine peptidase n=1 Tax=Flavobacterium ardleyense TaxID=2038737 RepID=A0ABW5ZA41_9FLAO
MNKQQLSALLVVFFCVFSYSQTKEDISKITKDYDVEKIQQKISYYKKLEDLQKAKAIAVANKNGWPIIIKGENGAFQQLMKLTPDGFPVYYSTSNVNAARSTRASFLNTGGGMGLTLDGQAMVARVWDGGTVRRSHSAFGNRVTTVDDNSTDYSDHATHVTGTMIALPWSGGPAGAKGMASAATARTFDWDYDESEALSEVLMGMLISNHSYGVPIGSGSSLLPAWYIGAYTDDARNWDEIAYLSPYYLPVMSAGNDGDSNKNTNPIAAGYDKLNGNKNSKNALIVANAQDAVINSDGSLYSVSINSSSSQGPTDDRRIKPDITGNGTNVTSSTAGSNTSTAAYSGTSMAGPNVAGTLLLVQQHHKNLTNSFMKAATLRGLACHTADDAGNTGPDAKFGWGLLNAKQAVETLTGNGLDSWVSENNLSQGQSYTMTFRSNGTVPLIASITWTDLPGVANNGNLGANDTTPALVNDLDIRVTKDGETYYPWMLQQSPSALAIRTGDNNVDNIEVVKIDSPVAGDYVVTISHKGTLVTGAQAYSLIVTGVASDFSLTSKSEDLSVCSSQTTSYVFDYKQKGRMNTTFSAVDLPTGASAVFTPSSLSANGTVTMTILGLENVRPGTYAIGIKGSNGTESETRFKQLKVYSSTFEPAVLLNPANAFNGTSTTVNFDWESSTNSESYMIQVATNPAFTNILYTFNTTDSKYTVPNLAQESTYYWRVISSNRCGVQPENTATINSFVTGVLSCGNTFMGTDFSNTIIAKTGSSIASVAVEVTGGLTIGELKLSLNIAHTYVEDMTISLKGPASIGSPVIVLFKEPCGNHDNIDCVVVDSGGLPQCEANPAIYGDIRPMQPLGQLIGLPADGTWTLLVEDPYNGDGGMINGFSIDICALTTSLSATNFNINSLIVYPNPTKGIINIDLNGEVSDNTTYELFDIQGRRVALKVSSNTVETLNVESLSDGIYLLTIQNSTGKTNKKIVISK